jgi:putative mRNA 3-end processing factor
MLQAPMTDLVIAQKEGLYCIPGQFHIDPWQPVDRAVITHAHADHARPGHGRYLAAAAGAAILKARLGNIHLETLAYGERITHNGVTLSFHPAGHVLGSSQVRLEYRGEVWVASGDYKMEADPTCDAFEPLPCHTFITESTFGLPIYRWQPQRVIFDEVNDWWRSNAAEGRASVLFCYALGKAQRILSGVDSTIGAIVCHGATEAVNRIYRQSGIALPPTSGVSDMHGKTDFRGALVLAPPAAGGTPWMRRFGEYGDAFASGWMLLRGARRRRAIDRGFIMSDHADWPGLMRAIKATGASRVIVTHGHVDIMVRWLQENGLQAEAFGTEYGMEESDNVAINESIAFKESHA